MGPYVHYAYVASIYVFLYVAISAASLADAKSPLHPFAVKDREKERNHDVIGSAGIWPAPDAPPVWGAQVALGRGYERGCERGYEL
jgi:hypothetical protein